MGSSGGHETLDLVVGPGAGGLGLGREVGNLVVPLVHGDIEVLTGLLCVLLDLGSVGSDVGVHAVDASVGRGGPRVGGLLPGGNSELELLSGLTLVVGSILEGTLVTAKVLLVTPVVQVSVVGELHL